jgi:protein-L-isoaspartate(D-aspartate) O-methyltransferase
MQKNIEGNADADRAARLRGEGVDKLVAEGWVTCERVEAAMRAVPRHLFAPESPLEEAYAPEKALRVMRDEHGTGLSSVSAPYIQAMMLEQAQIAPGMRVLEVGSGGYNAALIAELAGPAGQVVTVDLDPEIAGRASRFLAEAGYSRVRVVLADAEAGVPEHAPYDAIVVTAGAWDIPPAWTGQLADGGRLVVPLRMRGLTRSVAFTRAGDNLVSDSVRICGFVPMRGAGAHRPELLLVAGTAEVGLRFDDALPGDPSLLDGAVRTERAERWTGVTVRPDEPYDMLQLYLASMLPGFCVMVVDPDLDTGLVAPARRDFSMAAVDGASFAYVIWRRLPGARLDEFGVHAHGPGRAALAGAVACHVRAWDREQRGGPGPRIEVWPAGAPDESLPAGRVFAKGHARVVISWPAASDAAVSQHDAPDLATA